MNTKPDIQTIEHIKILVDEFYAKIRVDQLLGGIFNGAVKERWPEHLEKMYRFWQTVLLEEHTYKGSPFVPHASLQVEQAHFDRWLILFNETVDSHFAGGKAERAKWQGARMAELFLSKIQYYRDHPAIPIL